jgi:hypothetical protein
MSDPDKQTAVGSFDIQRQMPNQSAFTIHGYIFDSDFEANGGAKALNARVDTLFRVAERQILISGLEMLDGQERQALQHIEQIKDHMVGLSDKQKNAVKLTPQDKTNMRQADATIAGAKKALDKIKNDRVELQTKIKALS